MRNERGKELRIIFPNWAPLALAMDGEGAITGTWIYGSGGPQSAGGR